MADSALAGDLFSQFLTWLFSSGEISVPAEFHERCNKIYELVDDDVSGVVNSLLNYAIQSASSAKYHVECSEPTLQKLLNSWLQEVNLEVNGVPTGLASLSREYFKERWSGSSFCMLRAKGWQKISADGTTIEVPTVMWFANGASIYVKRVNEKNYKLGSDRFFLDLAQKNEVVNSNKEYVTIQKPFNRWFDKYATPYLIKNGVYKNWVALKVLQSKGDEAVAKALPYLFLMTKGLPDLFLQADINYSDTELKTMVDNFKSEMEKYKAEKGRIPAHGVPFDQKYEHMIPDLSKIVSEELYRQGYRAILSGLGFIDVIQGLSSTRRESILNPKPFVSEVNDGVEGFKLMLLDVIYQIIDRNRDLHKKLFSDKGKILITNSPLKINVEQILDAIRSGYDRGPISIRSYLEALGFDFETEKEQRVKELKDGLEDLFYPHLVQNQEAVPDRISPSKPKTNKQENLEDEGKKPKSPEAKKFKQAAVDELDVQCKKCSYIFDYLSVPEAGMGYTRCPKCKEVVLQTYVAEASIVETEDYYRVRQVEPSLFDEDTFRTIWISKIAGIKAIIGRRKGEETTTIQSLLFQKDKWTPTEIKKWIKEHSDRFHAYAELVDANIQEDIEMAPYKDNSELPKAVKRYPSGAQNAFRETFNNVYEKTHDDSKSFPIAWNALKRWMKKHGYAFKEGKWFKKSSEEKCSEEIKDK